MVVGCSCRNALISAIRFFQFIPIFSSWAFCFSSLPIGDRFHRQLSRNPHWQASGALHPHRSYFLWHSPYHPSVYWTSNRQSQGLKWESLHPANQRVYCHHFSIPTGIQCEVVIGNYVCHLPQQPGFSRSQQWCSDLYQRWWGWRSQPPAGMPDLLWVQAFLA